VTEPFRVITADCPWRPGDSLPGKTRGAAKQYKTMTVDHLCTFELPPIAPDCVLFLWRLSIMQEEALRVARAWGFNPTKGELVWAKMTPSGKQHFGMGRILRGSHESCIVATRGKPTPLHHSQRDLFSAPVPRVGGRIIHSAKPDAFYEIVRGLFDGPRAALFERKQRPGFECFGDQLPESAGAV
jgi:N6-adenosine-specific RNA methylase IME4